jgi:hypothetical protein
MVNLVTHFDEESIWRGLAPNKGTIVARRMRSGVLLLNWSSMDLEDLWLPSGLLLLDNVLLAGCIRRCHNVLGV